MSARIFDIDPLTGTKKIFHYDHSDDSFTIQTQQDVTQIIDDNKRQLAGESSKGRKWKGDLHKVASIPMSVYAELMASGIANDQKRLAQWVNDQDNAAYRVKGGRV